jgi:hypothetical protein
MTGEKPGANPAPASVGDQTSSSSRSLQPNTDIEVDQRVGVGPLRQVLLDTMERDGASMKNLTVLAAQNDPFRVDTPARHRDGEWLAITAQRLKLGDRTIHLRGLHYRLIGEPKPNGLPLVDSDDDFAEQCRGLINSKSYGNGVGR